MVDDVIIVEAAAVGSAPRRLLYRLHTWSEVIARVLLVVLRRGSLRAAGAVTGHMYETIGGWPHVPTWHAEALDLVTIIDLTRPGLLSLSWILATNAAGTRSASQRARPIGNPVIDSDLGNEATDRRGKAKLVGLGRPVRPVSPLPGVNGSRGSKGYRSVETSQARAHGGG